MPITTVTWLMTAALAMTYIMLISMNNRIKYHPERRVENDRRQFSYDRHIPERRSGMNRRLFATASMQGKDKKRKP